MRDFFKPWRRKAGVMALGMACVFMAGWVRSFGYVDTLGVRFTHQLPGMIAFGFQSFRGRIGLQRPGMVSYPCPPGLSSIPITALPPRFLSLEDGALVVCQFPYWLIVIPLTLLSTWLLFSKTRPQPQLSQAPETDNLNTGRRETIGLEQIKHHLSNIHGTGLYSDDGDEKRDA